VQTVNKIIRLYLHMQLKFTYFLIDLEYPFRLNGKGERCTTADSLLQSLILPIKAYPSRKSAVK
jgi:hypothetical protein